MTNIAPNGQNAPQARQVQFKSTEHGSQKGKTEKGTLQLDTQLSRQGNDSSIFKTRQQSHAAGSKSKLTLQSPFNSGKDL